MKTIRDYIEACEINEQDPSDMAQERYNNLGAEVTAQGIWLPGNPGCWVSHDGELDFLAWVEKQKDRIETELVLAREIRATTNHAAALAREGNRLAGLAADGEATAKKLEALRRFLFPKETAMTEATKPRTGIERDWCVLDHRVLAVLIINHTVGDWAAYVGAVPGVRHSEEWRSAMNRGTELPRLTAVALFAGRLEAANIMREKAGQEPLRWRG